MFHELKHVAIYSIAMSLQFITIPFSLIGVSHSQIPIWECNFPTNLSFAMDQLIQFFRNRYFVRGRVQLSQMILTKTFNLLNHAFSRFHWSSYRMGELSIPPNTYVQRNHFCGSHVHAYTFLERMTAKNFLDGMNLQFK